MNSSATTSISSSTSSIAINNSPTGCPGLNGTLYKNNPSACQAYQYECGQSYNDSDFWGPQERWTSPQECASACDAQNGFGTISDCVGIVWIPGTDGSVVCKRLRSRNNPFYTPDANALVLVPDNDSLNCTQTATTSTITPTYSNTPTSSTSSYATTTWSNWNWNGTTTSSVTSTTASNSMTQAGLTTTSMPVGNTSTTAANSTTSAIATEDRWLPGTISGGWGPWMHRANSTCVSSTVTINNTVFSTVTSTVTDNKGGNTVTVTSGTTQTVTQIQTTNTVTNTVTVSGPVTTLTVTKAGEGGEWTAWGSKA